MSRFIHPAHAKGLRSTPLSPPSKPLTDRAIRRYVLAGYYGEEAKEAELAKVKPKAKAKSPKPQSLKDFSHLL